MSEKQKNTVADFMTNHVHVVRADHILEQAEKVLHEHRLTTAPVIIDKKNIIGILSDFHLMKFFLIRNAKPSRARIQDYQEELDPVILVEQTDSIETAFKMMAQSKNHRIYVTDNKKLVGALSPRDLLPFLAGEEAIQRDEEHKDLIDARIKIKSLMSELAQTQTDLENYSQVFSASPYMIHSVDLDGNIIMANPMLHYILGYAEGELVGKSILEIYPQQYHYQVKEGLHHIKIKGYHPIVNTMMVKKTKELVTVDMATAARHNEAGEIIATVTTSRISDSVKMIDALAQMSYPPSGIELKK